MATTYYAPDPIQSTQFIPGGAVPANGGQLFFYLAGTSTKQTVYKDNAAAVSWTNPIVLDSGGNLPLGGEVWFSQGTSYKVIFAPSTDSDPPGAPYWTKDNLVGLNDVTTTVSEWISGPTPTFVSSTSFTLVGNQTATFDVGRALRLIDSSGTNYSRIRTSAFGALTTVTIEDAILDAGLSAVSYSIISGTFASNGMPLALDTDAIAVGSADITKKVRVEVDTLLTTGTTRIWTAQDKDITVAGLLDIQGIGSVRRSASRNNTTTPNGQWDMNALKVVAHNSSTNVLMIFNAPATQTVNISTAGPTPNGRDQAGAFSSASFVHFYWIATSTGVLDGIASSSGPAIGPTLTGAASSYVLWQYDSTVRLSGGNILSMYSFGNRMFYTSTQPFLTGGSSSAETSHSAQVNALVPADIAEEFGVSGAASVADTGVSAVGSVFFYVSSGVQYAQVASLNDVLQVGGQPTGAGNPISQMIPATGYFAYIFAGGATARSLNLAIPWFTVPNGG